jgi:hypothetical protein
MLHDKKELLPKLDTNCGILSDLKLVQLLNELLPIVVTDSAIVT